MWQEQARSIEVKVPLRARGSRAFGQRLQQRRNVKDRDGDHEA